MASLPGTRHFISTLNVIMPSFEFVLVGIFQPDHLYNTFPHCRNCTTLSFAHLKTIPLLCLVFVSIGSPRKIGAPLGQITSFPKNHGKTRLSSSAFEFSTFRNM